MGFLDKLFGVDTSKKTLQTIAGEMRISVAPRECEMCGDTFLLPASPIAVQFALQPAQIDVGGYCSDCRQYMCPKHTKVLNTQAEVEGRSRDVWVASCGQCGVPLLPEP